MAYIFGGGTGETPDSIKHKRRVAEQLARRASSGTPRNVGEGLSQLGSAIAARLAMGRADKAEQAGVAAQQAAWGQIGGALGLGGGDAAGPVETSFASHGSGSIAPADLGAYLVEGQPETHLQFNDTFTPRLQAFLAAAPDGGASIFSGYRSPERQAQLWEEALKKYGSPEAARKWVAPPGSSQHNHGNAADLRYASPEVKKWAHENAGRYGLHFRMGHEPWHIEPMEDWSGSLPGSAPLPQMGNMDVMMQAGSSNGGLDAQAIQDAYQRQQQGLSPVGEIDLSAMPAYQRPGGTVTPLDNFGPGTSQHLAANNQPPSGAPMNLLPQGQPMPLQPQARPQPGQMPGMPLPQGVPMPGAGAGAQEFARYQAEQMRQAGRGPGVAIQQLLAGRGGGQGAPNPIARMLAGNNQQAAPQQQVMQPQGQPQMQGAPVGGGNNISQILQNPWVPDGIKSALLQRELSKKEPPKPTSAIQEYEYAKTQGYQGSFTDFQTDLKRAGKPETNVTVGGGRYGTIPQGYELRETPQGAQLVPIPGGPAALEQQQAEDAKASAGESQQRYGSVVLEDIGRVREKVENAPWYSPTVGLGAGLLANVPGTGAADVKELTGTIRANIGFDRLAAMREASPTGGALGNVTERELSRLEATLGSLEQSQSEGQFLQNLERLDSIYRDIMKKAGAYPNAAEFGFGGQQEAAPAADPQAGNMTAKTRRVIVGPDGNLTWGD